MFSHLLRLTVTLRHLANNVWHEESINAVLRRTTKNPINRFTARADYMHSFPFVLDLDAGGEWWPLQIFGQSTNLAFRRDGRGSYVPLPKKYRSDDMGIFTTRYLDLFDFCLRHSLCLSLNKSSRYIRTTNLDLEHLPPSRHIDARYRVYGCRLREKACHRGRAYNNINTLSLRMSWTFIPCYGDFKQWTSVNPDSYAYMLLKFVDSVKKGSLWPL